MNFKNIKNKDNEEEDNDICLMHVCLLSLSSRARLFVTPVDCSLTGFSVHGILQARILGWIAITSSRESFQTHVSCAGRQILNHGATREAPSPLWT